MDLQTALVPDGGLACAVGAGGKKSTLYRLAEQFDRAVVAATVRIPIFDSRVGTVRIAADPVGELGSVPEDEWPLGLVPEQERPDRYRGYERDIVAAISREETVEATLVKADGARMRELKAPGDHEPQIPVAADVVLPIASVHAVGEPLTADTVHRPERVAGLTGRAVGERIRPEDVAATLADPDGGLKGVPADATAVPVLNKVDDEGLERRAREVAAEIHDRVDVPYVALTRMTADRPLVDVVE